MITTNASKQDLLTKQCLDRIYTVLRAKTLEAYRLSNRFGLINCNTCAILLSHAIHQKLDNFEKVLTCDDHLFSLLNQFHDAKRTIHIDNGYIPTGVYKAQRSGVTDIVAIMRLCSANPAQASTGQRLDLSGLTIEEKQDRALKAFRGVTNAVNEPKHPVDNEFTPIDLVAKQKLIAYEALELTRGDLTRWSQNQSYKWQNSEINGRTRLWWFFNRMDGVDKDLIIADMAKLYKKRNAA